MFEQVYDRRGSTDVKAEHRSSQVQLGLSYTLHVIIIKSETRKTKEYETDTDCLWMKALQLLLIVQHHH